MLAKRRSHRDPYEGLLNRERRRREFEADSDLSDDEKRASAHDEKAALGHWRKFELRPCRMQLLPYRVRSGSVSCHAAPYVGER